MKKIKDLFINIDFISVSVGCLIVCGFNLFNTSSIVIFGISIPIIPVMWFALFVLFLCAHFIKRLWDRKQK